jgi:hypothetical protein
VRISDYLQHSLASARRTKEWTCRKHPADIHPYVGIYRADEQVAVVTLQHHQRDEILTTARVCAVGFDADVLGITFETYIADHKNTDGINPVTGRRWGPNEMQDVAINHGGVEKGWVSEALTISVANRAGDIGMISLPFRYSGKYLVFGESTGDLISTDRENAVSGLMPDALRQAMLRPSSAVEMPDFERIDRADRDILTTMMLRSKLDCAVLLISELTDQDRVRKLREVGKVLGTDDLE